MMLEGGGLSCAPVVTFASPAGQVAAVANYSLFTKHVHRVFPKLVCKCHLALINPITYCVNQVFSLLLYSLIESQNCYFSTMY